MIALKVREFTNADDIIAHAKACRERIRNAKARPAPIAPTILVPREPRKPAMPPKPEGLTIYAWPIGPRPLHDVMNVATPPIKEGGVKTAKTIISEVCAKYSVGLLDVRSERRTQNLVIPRQEIAYRLRTETSLSFPHMGRLLWRDHTTLLYGARKYAQRLARGEVAL